MVNNKLSSSTNCCIWDVSSLSSPWGKRYPSNSSTRHRRRKDVAVSKELDVNSSKSDWSVDIFTRVLRLWLLRYIDWIGLDWIGFGGWGCWFLVVGFENDMSNSYCCMIDDRWSSILHTTRVPVLCTHTGPLIFILGSGVKVVIGSEINETIKVKIGGSPQLKRLHSDL